MINKINIKNIDIDSISRNLSKDNINELVILLNQKDCIIRENSLLILQSTSKLNSDIYKYLDHFKEKLNNSNSFQRNIALILISENIRWDNDLAKFKDMYEKYMAHCTDDKFITSRYAIKNIINFIPYTEEYLIDIARKLIKIDLFSFKESQSKLILLDIINTLIEINKYKNIDDIDLYIENAMMDNLLSKKEKEMIISKYKIL